MCSEAHTNGREATDIVGESSTHSLQTETRRRSVKHFVAFPQQMAENILFILLGLPVKKLSVADRSACDLTHISSLIRHPIDGRMIFVRDNSHEY
jgi:hypothetical protein